MSNHDIKCSKCRSFYDGHQWDSCPNCTKIISFESPMKTKTEYIAHIIGLGYYKACLAKPFVKEIEGAARFSSLKALKDSIIYANNAWNKKAIKSYEIIEVITHVTTHYIEKVNL